MLPNPLQSLSFCSIMLPNPLQSLSFCSIMLPESREQRGKVSQGGRIRSKTDHKGWARIRIVRDAGVKIQNSKQVKMGQARVRVKGQGNGRTQNPNISKGLDENRKSNAKKVIHKSKTQSIMHKSNAKVCRASLPRSRILAAFSKDELEIS